VLFYLSAFLGAWIGSFWQDKDATWKLGMHASIFIVTSIIVVAIMGYFSATKEKIECERREKARLIEQRKQLERDALASAHAHCDRVLSEIIGSVEECPNNDNIFINRYCASLESIRSYVKAAYLTFEDKFGQGSDPLERVNFEVTFMTLSHKDAAITIPACANRDNRSPRSMVLRVKQRDIYKDTETARIYSAPRPEPVIISDTSNEAKYSELYPGELSRLRSSIIYPVLSDKNELLGTLVLHCDKAKFFDASMGKYWYELIEIFAKRIALEKKKIDMLVSGKSQSLILTLPTSPEF
jgi:GAF domain-containing protein